VVFLTDHNDCVERRAYAWRFSLRGALLEIIAPNLAPPGHANSGNLQPALVKLVLLGRFAGRGGSIYEQYVAAFRLLGSLMQKLTVAQFPEWYQIIRELL